MKRMWSKNELKNLNNANAIELLGNGQVPSIKGDEIIENMSGYSAEVSPYIDSELTLGVDYCGAVKNGNKLTFALAGSISRTEDAQNGSEIVIFTIPADVDAKLFEISLDNVSGLAFTTLYMANTYSSGANVAVRLVKGTTPNTIKLEFYNISNLTKDVEYAFRYECTFLLSDTLIAQD